MISAGYFGIDKKIIDLLIINHGKKYAIDFTLELRDCGGRISHHLADRYIEYINNC